MSDSRPRRFPTGGEYTEALQNPTSCFDDPELRSGEVECNVLGLPRPRSGNFASVFKVTSQDGEDFAVKCFLAPPSDQAERYAAIGAALEAVSDNWEAGFEYLEEGITVAGSKYPVLKMDWVEGVSLGAFLQEHHEDRTVMATLAERFVSVMDSVRSTGIAHGDLQHGNILISPEGEVKLIDYDGMYVPALADNPPNELGHQNYQSPNRVISDYGPEVDNFSAWVIYVSLAALSVDPTLWDDVNRNDPDCLLFRKADFLDPDGSAALETLESLNNEGLTALVQDFRAYMKLPLAEIPPLGTDPIKPSGMMGSREGALPTRPRPERTQAAAPQDSAIPGQALGSLLWKVEFRGEIHHAPVVHGSLVYIPGEDGVLYALSAVNGHEQWRFATNGAISATPLLYETVLFVPSQDRHIYALDVNTGQLLGYFQVWAEVKSLHLEGGLLVVTCWDRAYAINPATGQEMWTLQIGTGNAGGCIANGLLVIGSEKFAHTIDIATGQRKWKFKHGGAATVPHAHDGRVYISGKGRHYAIDSDRGNQVWEQKAAGNPATLLLTSQAVYVDNGDGHISKLDLADGRELWRFGTGTGVAVPALDKGVLHVGTWDQHLHAVDDATGQQLWKSEENIGAAASPTVSNSAVFVGSRNHFFYTFRTA